LYANASLLLKTPRCLKQFRSKFWCVGPEYNKLNYFCQPKIWILYNILYIVTEYHTTQSIQSTHSIDITRQIRFRYTLHKERSNDAEIGGFTSNIDKDRGGGVPGPKGQRHVAGG
jgi:hypothetical protein